MTKKRAQLSLGLSLAFLLAVCSCKPVISLYDQYAYSQAVNIKVDILNTMDLATSPYASHQQEITAVLTEIQKMQEYDKNREHNEVTTKQWELLMDPASTLFGSFLNKWKAESTESPVYIAEKKKEITEAINQIIKLEISKNK